MFHARFAAHAYPSHTHEAWTLLIVDDGVVRYDLDRHEHGALRSQVTLLPPGVPHDGRTVRPEGFRKRVLYLNHAVLDADLVGAAVDHPGLPDPMLRRRIETLHDVLVARRVEPRVMANPSELDSSTSPAVGNPDPSGGPPARPRSPEAITGDLEAQSRFALILDRLRGHLRPGARPAPAGRGTAHRLRDLLDAHLPAGLPLEAAAAILGAHPASLVRAFSREFGIPPHRYLTGRRLELARRHLLDGHSPADAAVHAGFYDQAHLTRHFTRLLGVGPARYALGSRQ